MKIERKLIKRTIMVFAGVILMGFALSFLNRTGFGTDPCTAMNLGVSAKIGLSLGTWQLLFNLILFIIVLWKDRSQIGIGTIANMVLVGYAMDFFTWIENFFIAEGYFTSMAIRVLVLIPALALFIVAAALYMSLDMGTAPYDSLPLIIADHIKKIEFKYIRMAWDITATIVAIIIGGRVGLVTIAVAFFLGPVITLLKNKIQKFI